MHFYYKGHQGCTRITRSLYLLLRIYSPWPWIFLFVSIYINSLSQSPEISLREFASSQIKKGVRSIGMGGNGATWGNYALTWRDSGTALVNAGVTSYPNKNNFSFTVLGVNSPTLKNHWVFYVMALSQFASDITLKIKSPALGSNPSSVTGDGSNQAMFFRGARPLGHGFSAGFLLAYERSQFSVNEENNPANFVRYVTGWLPSGGIGLTWQPNKRWLFGFRGLFNHDNERRIDNLGTYKGLNLSHEYRLGLSYILWEGALIDIGANMRHRSNQVNHTLRNDFSPNLGFEQSFWSRQLALRFGLDESSPTCGLSIRKLPFVVDVAYIHNLGRARLGTLYGSTNNSIMATLTYNYRYKRKIKS